MLSLVEYSRFSGWRERGRETTRLLHWSEEEDHVITTCDHYMFSLHVITTCFHYMFSLHVTTAGSPARETEVERHLNFTTGTGRTMLSLHVITSAVRRLKYLNAINHINVIVNSRLIAHIFLF